MRLNSNHRPHIEETSVKTEAVAKLLAGLQERLTGIAKQSDEAISRLGNALERIHRLRNELEQLELQLETQNSSTASADETAEHVPLAR